MLRDRIRARGATAARRSLARVGLEIGRRRPDNIHSTRADLLRRAGVASVIDVGANEGQWAGMVLERGYAGPLLSLEPGSEAFRALTARASAHPPWLVERCAAGAAPATLTLNVAGGTYASSFLPTASWVAEGSELARASSEDVQVEPLDHIVARHALPGPYLLKVDTQGFEREVLAGASSVLGRTVALEIELSFRSLYAGQPPAHEMLALIDDLGFGLVGLYPGYADPRTGYALELDGLFVRRA